MKILIVDDESSIREGLAKYIRLHTDRFEAVLTAANGDEALDNIFKFNPEIMLLDIQIPKKNGIEVMKEARKADMLPITIILSCHDDFTYAQQALHLGASEYILKPSRSSDILALINKMADEKYGPFTEEVPALNKPDSLNSYVNEAINYIDENFHNDITLDDVALKIGISAGYLSTLFKQSLNMGFIDYLNKVRIDKACVYLTQNSLKTYEIAYKVGFKDEKYFSRVFKKLMGLTTNEFKKSGSD